MRYNHAVFFCVLAATPVCANLASCSTSRVPKGRSAMHVEAKTSCLQQSDVANALQKMATANSQAESNGARDVIRNELGRSEECRRDAVGAIVRIMDAPNATFEGDPHKFNLWRAGAQILGESKSVEALDLLISHLDLQNHMFSSTMSQQPALLAIIEMGPVALSKLETILRSSKNPDMRRYAVYCISSIGGRSAIRALNESLASETDPCVKRFIRVALENLNLKDYKLSTDNTKWFSAFQCHD
jgi:hypothetical protein